MSNSHTPEDSQSLQKRRGWVWVAVPTILIIGVLAILFRGAGEARRQGTTFAVRRGNLPIVISERGSVEALESQDYRSHIRGWSGARILSIVEEGYLVTEEDVKGGKVLIELDSTDLRTQLVEETSSFQDLISQLVEAEQVHKSTLLENESNIQAAQLALKFARMDLEKYLGQEVTKDIIDLLALPSEELDMDSAEPKKTEGEEENVQAERPDEDKPRETPERSREDGDRGRRDRDGEKPAETVSLQTPEDILAGVNGPIEEADTPIAFPDINFSKYAKRELLGDGAAQQRLRELEDTFVLAQEELTLAETQLEGTRRLAEKGFVTKNDLERDQMAVNRGTIKLASAETARNLFIKYEFPKTSEQLLSDYLESFRALQRTRYEAEAQLTRTRGRLQSRIAKYNIQKDEIEELKEQIEQCTIRAEHVGLVVYASSLDDFDPEEDRIKEGANVRRRRKIITIPDTTKMGVRLKVHESAVKKVAPGQQAQIRVDAFPDRPLEGEVVNVSALPDAKERAANPDVKVYPVSVRIHGYHEWLKPGMTAQVSISVKTVEDVLYVPVQAIVPSGGERLCFVARRGEGVRRPVETGEYSDVFIEIKSGLEEGEEVLLRAPEGFEPAEAEEESG